MKAATKQPVQDDFISLKRLAESQYFNFKPRPDDAGRFDQQAGFVNSRTTGLAFLIGGTGAGTTEVAMHKLARFIFETPPPRENTPFWVIGPTLRQVGQICWAEKLAGHGHIPECEVEHKGWHQMGPGWPAWVKMKPWPNRPGKNWMLHFHSADQSRANLQGASIGGFCFTEQCPWEIVIEVYARCREYNFPGSKFYEFTPLDPRLTFHLQQMQQSNKLPEGWEIYRANTAVALEFGHCDPTWFKDFYGTLPEDQKATRLIGAWATFKNQVYQTFNDRIHCAEIVAPDTGVYHVRAIDWGSGPENAFVCLWGFRNGLGQWFIYDEFWSTSGSMQRNLEHVRERHPWPHDRHSEWHRIEELRQWYGHTWADPAGRDWINWCNEQDFCGPLQMQGASNAVDPGIECVKRHLEVSEMIGQPLLIIDKERCPNLFREMNTYQYEQGTGPISARNPKDARPVPLKIDDHACTIASMVVLTKGGWKPIIEIAAGEIVASHCGWTSVLCGATQTGVDRLLVRVILESGAELVCTPDHEFLTTDGICPAHALARRFLVQSQKALVRPEGYTRKFGIQEFAGEDILRRRTSLHTTFNAIGTGFCTEESTKTSGAEFPRRFMSTIKARMYETIIPETLSCLPVRSTKSSTKPPSLRCSGRRLCGEKIIPRSQAGWRGTLPAITGRIPSERKLNAISAARNLKQPICDSIGQDIALINAHQNLGEPSRSNAGFAEIPFGATPFVRKGFVAANVLLVLDVVPAGRDDTYCIATESGTMVWDGGCVVRNCDALRYLLYSESRYQNVEYANADRPSSVSHEMISYGSNRHGNPTMRESQEGTAPHSISLSGFDKTAWRRSMGPGFRWGSGR